MSHFVPNGIRLIEEFESGALAVAERVAHLDAEIARLRAALERVVTTPHAAAAVAQAALAGSVDGDAE